MIERTLISFSGYPIIKISTGEMLTEKEINFIKNLNYKNHYETNTKLSLDSKILNNIELKRVKDLMSEHFKWYIDTVIEIENEFYMCNSWCTIQNKGDRHPSHMHPGAIYSSTFYAKTDNSGLYFSVDRSKIQEGFNFDYKVKSYNQFNALSWLVEVKAGDLLIFPANIRHESKTHESDSERIMIGSSYFIKGNLGFNYKYNDIVIK